MKTNAKSYRLRPDHYAWLHAKGALIIWAVLLFIYTPSQVSWALGWLLSGGISLAVVTGLTLSVVGLFRSMSLNTLKSKKGTNLELAGLYIAIAGPAAYCVTQFFLAFAPDAQRQALTAFAYAVCALLYVRIVLVTMHRKRSV